MIKVLNMSPEDLAKEKGHAANGHIEVDFEVEGIDASAPRTFAVLPSKYDARERGIITPVRNQGAWGSCWTFATMAMAESAYLRLHPDSDKNSINFSEVHLLYFVYDGNY